MRAWRAWNGQTFPVSDWYAESIDAAIGRRWPSFQGCNVWLAFWKMVGRLSIFWWPDDGQAPAGLKGRLIRWHRRKLRAYDNIISMHRAVTCLRGRDLREIFGPTASIDQVHENAGEMACGCIVAHIFDHHKRADHGKTLHPHYPYRVCERHMRDHNDIENFDFARHYRALTGKG